MRQLTVSSAAQSTGEFMTQTRKNLVVEAGSIVKVSEQAVANANNLRDEAGFQELKELASKITWNM